MYAGGGYQSDLNVTGSDLIGAGTTTGTGAIYALALDPPLTQTYQEGLLLHVRFHVPNSGAATLDVDGQGAVPLVRVEDGGTFSPLLPEELNATTLYQLIHDGTNFQVITGLPVIPPDASETRKGITRFATTLESTDGANNTTAITPQKMVAYVSTRVTSLWNNQGLIDCSDNPDYPEGERGDAFTVSVGGRIGGPTGEEVQPHDIIYCFEENPGGDFDHWEIVRSDFVPATEALSGLLRIAAQAQVDAGTDDASAVTPLKLASRLAALVNRSQELLVLDTHLSEGLATGSRNRYRVVNGNLVLPQDIRLQPDAGITGIDGWVLNFPLPQSAFGAIAGVCFSEKGAFFRFVMNADGQVSLTGDFDGANDALLFTPQPYVARFPIQYHDAKPPSL